MASAPTICLTETPAAGGRKPLRPEYRRAFRRRQRGNSNQHVGVQRDRPGVAHSAAGGHPRNRRQLRDVRCLAGRQQRGAHQCSDQVGHQRTSRPGLRKVSEQLHERRAVLLQRLARYYPKGAVLESQSIRRNARRPHQEGQAVLLPLLSGRSNRGWAWPPAPPPCR